MKKYLQRNLKGSLGAVSSTTTYISPYQRIDMFEKYMIQIAWTGTPTASVTLLVSADPVPSTAVDPNTYAPTVTDTVANSSTSTAGISVITFEITATSGNFVALKWVNASGTGTITSINFVGKGSLV